VLNECEKFDVDSLVRTPEQAADGFVAKNTVALEDGTFQCPLSGKRFRGPAFVKTHIVSKYDGALKKSVWSTICPRHARCIARVKLPAPTPSVCRLIWLNKSSHRFCVISPWIDTSRVSLR
jgi:hypothetical protein